MNTAPAQMKFTGQLMRTFVAKWESCFAQPASTDAPVDEELLVTMFTEFIGHLSKLLYGVTLSAFFTKNDHTWQVLTSQLLQDYRSQSARKMASYESNGTYVASSNNDNKKKRRTQNEM